MNARRTARSLPASSPPVAPALTRRRHIDLARVAAATCR
ncbi:putative leader peptide [Streptomyces sp. NPDC055103]